MCIVRPYAFCECYRDLFILVYKTLVRQSSYIFFLDRTNNSKYGYIFLFVWNVGDNDTAFSRKF